VGLLLAAEIQEPYDLTEDMAQHIIAEMEKVNQEQ
jgi:hypothetical protein